MSADHEANPFPVVVDVATLPKSGFPVSEKVSPAQMRDVAVRFDLREVESFSVEGRMFRWRSKGARFEGEMSAKVTAACVVTGASVNQTIKAPLDITFVTDGSRLARPQAGPEVDSDGELILDFEAADPPELFTGTSIDIGTVILEIFSLELDPFPRAPDAPERLEFTTLEEGQSTDAEKPSPFAALAALKERNPGNDDS
ncbi:MAG: DUF177 domain-containing protein [Pseudomonadota bacterium]